MKSPQSTESFQEARRQSRQEVARASTGSVTQIDHHYIGKDSSVGAASPKLLLESTDERLCIDQIIDYLSVGLDDLSDDILLRLKKARSDALAHKQS